MEKKYTFKVDGKEYDRKTYDLIGNRVVLIEDIISITYICKSCGVYWKDNWGRDLNPELRFNKQFCLGDAGSKSARFAIHDEFISDITKGSKKIFSKQIKPGHPIEMEGHKDFENFFIIEYATNEDLYDDLISAKNFIDSYEKGSG